MQLMYLKYIVGVSKSGSAAHAFGHDRRLGVWNDTRRFCYVSRVNYTVVSVVYLAPCIFHSVTMATARIQWNTSFPMF